MTKPQKNQYHNAGIDRLYIQTRPTPQAKRVLDTKSGLYIHQPCVHKRFVSTDQNPWTKQQNNQWSAYRHGVHYKNSLDPFRYLLKSWEPPRFFAYLSIKFSVHDPKIGHLYVAYIQAHLADAYHCDLAQDSIQDQCRVKIKIMKVNSFTSQDGKTYLEVHAQFVSNEQKPQPPSDPYWDSVNHQPVTNGAYWLKPTDQFSFIYCPKNRSKACPINTIWSPGDRHKRLQYSLPNQHFGNFISCQNPEFQVAYEAWSYPAYDQFLQIFKRKSSPRRLELKYSFERHYYHRSGKYHKRQDGFNVCLKVRVDRLIYPDDKNKVIVIGRICHTGFFDYEQYQMLEQPPSNYTDTSELRTRRHTEDDAHLFTPGGLITIVHNAKYQESSDITCIAHVVGPKTDITGAFPVIPV